MLIFETLLGLLAFSVLLYVAARRLKVPPAVMLVLGGMAVALVPGLPDLELEPELALALFLPPLLQVSAYRTDWTAFRVNIVLILLMALGAVVFTAVAVGSTVKWLAPELPWAAVIALGAIVAPPDAVAAISVLKSFKLPKRIVTVLEGESLINDASALVLYRFAVAATLAGSISLAEASGSFVLSAAGGGAIGFAVAFASSWILARLNDRLLEVVTTFIAGFAAYFAAEALHVSGVLAAVACGGWLGRQSLQFTARTRLETASTWDFVEFVLSSLVFTLIGLQLRGILERLEDENIGRLIALAVAASSALIVSRVLWVFGTFYPWAAIRSAFADRKIVPPLSYPLIISWAGMRGVVSLAAALALPAQFPGRDLILFLSFCAILVTLLLQGTTLGPLIRRLNVTEPEIEVVRPEVVAARKEVAAAALGVVAERLQDPEHKDVAEELVQDFQGRVERLESTHENPDTAVRRLESQLRLRLDAIAAARAKLAERRGELDGETFATLVQELDLEEEQIRVALGGA